MLRFLLRLITTVLSAAIGILLFLLLSPFSFLLAVVIAAMFAIFAILALFIKMSGAVTVLLAIGTIITAIIFIF